MKDKPRMGYCYDDLHVGMRFRSPGRTITDADLVGFAGLTGDYSELHTSDVYAQSSQFGRKVAHGMLGLAYLAAAGLYFEMLSARTLSHVPVDGGRGLHPVKISHSR